MAWKTTLSKFVRKYGPASKMVATSVLSFALPGSGAIINLVENAFDTAEKTAQNEWEDQLTQVAQCNAAELERLGGLLGMLHGELATFCDMAHTLKDQPGKIDTILQTMLHQDARLQESVALLRGIGQQFDCVHRKLDVTHEKILELHLKLDQFLQRHHIASTTNDPLHVSVTSERERELILGYRKQLRELPVNLVRADDWLMLGDGLAATGSFAEAQESHALAAVEARSHADIEKEAEAHFKAYRTCCELRRWNDALDSLNAAIALQPEQYRLFDSRYEPIAILGAGGFGTVFHCRDHYGRTDVAIKTLHAADLDRNLDEIFAEAHTLRQLDHPGIIRAYDHSFADTFKQERPYFVLEYFPGETLEAVIKRLGPLSLNDMLSIVAQIAEAVNAAHEQGILHRDLKPGNVMIRKIKKEWDVKVIDFGLAVRTKVATTASLHLSASQGTVRDASFTGTLEYASPEQKGKLPGIKVGPRSDVFSLGKTCLYLLFNTLEVKTKHWATLPESHRDAVQLLLERATDEDIQDRHRSMKELLGSLLALRGIVQTQPPKPNPAWEVVDEPIRVPTKLITPPKPTPSRKSRKPSPKPVELDDVLRYGMQYWHWGLLLGACCTVLLFAGILIYIGSGDSRSDKKPDSVAEKQTTSSSGKSWTPPTTFTQRGNDLPNERPPRFTPYQNSSVRKPPITDGPNTTNPLTINSIPQFKGHLNFKEGLAYSPDGKQIASGSANNTITITDATTGETLQTLRGHTSPVKCLAYNSDGRQIASGASNSSFIVWNAATGQPDQNYTRLAGAPSVDSIAFSSDDTLVALGTWSGVQIYNLETQQPTGGVQGMTRVVASVVFSPDGKFLAAATWNQTIQIWDAANGRLLRTINGINSPINSLAISPDSQQIACGLWANEIPIIDLAEGQIVQTLRGHTRAVNSVSFSPDGKQLVSGSDDQTIRIWNTTTGQPLRTLEGHKMGVENVAFSPNGKQIASGSSDGTMRIWDVSELSGVK